MGRLGGRERARLIAVSRQSDSEAGAAEGAVTASLRRFVLRFALLVALYFAVASSEVFETRFLAPCLDWNARAAGALLSGLGQERIRVMGNAVSGGVYAVRVDRGCDASTPIALFASLILAFPAALRRRLLGVVAGVPVLVGLNAVRIASLYWIGAYHRDLFFVIHTDVWQAVFVLAALSLWALWLLWAMRTPGLSAPAAP